MSRETKAMIVGNVLMELALLATLVLFATGVFHSRQGRATDWMLCGFFAFAMVCWGWFGIVSISLSLELDDSRSPAGKKR